MSNLPSSMPSKSLTLSRKILFTTIIFSFLLVLIIGTGEYIVRTKMKELYEKPTLVPPYDTAQKDKKLGWKMTPGYSYTGKMKNQDWSEYDISIHYDKNGFKVFGDTTSTLPKILFLGDSYTACIEVSNEKSFYSLLKDSLPAEVFAYGHAGFGTLQEYLVLDEWVDRIKPDVVVWEVCSNDFIDNYARLEIECGYKVGERRPYLAPDGDIYYRQPLSLWQRMKEHLFFFSWLEERWVLLVQRFFDVEKKVGEHFIAVDKRQYKTFDKAVLTTEKIVGMIRHRLPAACQLLAFSADIFQPQMEEFKRIFESYGAVFLEAPAREVERISLEQKVMTKAIDGYHWNEKGHQIVASELLPHLRKLTNREASRQKPGGK